MRSKTLRAVAVAGLLVALVSVSAKAVVVLQDTFTLGTRTGALNGKPIETSTIGAVNWLDSGGGWQFVTGDYVKSASGTHAAGISLGGAATNPTTVSTDLNFNGDAGSNKFGTVGFSITAAGATSGLPLWLQVGGDGAWSVRSKNGTNPVEVLASGLAGSLTTSGGYHTLKIQYTPATEGVLAWYDNTLLTTAPTALSFVPTIITATFGSTLTTNMLADNFVVDVTPEPATLALLAVAGLVALRRRTA